jgi:extradiol dioxygenase family protein
MLKKIAFTMYPVKDMKRARKFYETTLKLIPGSISAEGEWVEYDLPGGCFAITTLGKDVNPSANSGGGVAFEVENLDELVSQLKAEDIQFKLDIFSTPVCKVILTIGRSIENVMVVFALNFSEIVRLINLNRRI